MANRLNSISDHLQGGSRGLVQATSPDDVVIVAAYRSPIAKGFKGAFNELTSEEILYEFLVGFFDKVKIDKHLIQEVSCGNVLNAAAGATEHRAACLAAGIPYQAAFVALNRQCSSGLTAVNDIANKIQVGQIDVGLALGVESMTKNYKKVTFSDVSPNIKKDIEGGKCFIPMGFTNEKVAAAYSIPRSVQDEFAANSYQKAEKARASGLFNDEIIPIKTKDGSIATFDDGPREGVTAKDLSKLKPAFKQTGVTTAGNASQISDGAAGVLLARRSVAEKLGLPIVGKYLGFQAVGVPPEIMGVGPAYAIPAVLKQVGLTVEDIDVFEINEAFAAQALYCVEKLKIDKSKVNPRGGAIALGHPLGCTGARQVATILRELKKGQLGCVSMCIGTGMGAAAVFVKE
ncbi:HHR255Wp [Eremothecium sinecaudum]|uniref:HHR255Wp n=1 Tax=Eremothecium sinecaudum TaxID=45286 RepID=A0A0X8HWX1_9SACH|nr:HHR255Wp [Eremothecium sinecaudum]AMD23024.1 HHR255Wp [Eremothecium sinecaudum]